MEKISIIVPVYNTGEYLTTCVESIRGQTYSSWEMILVNDGSTDNSGELCDYFARMDERIKVIHQSNAGVSSARNAAIQIATGSYIGFADSDDWIEQDMFQKLYQWAIDSEADIIACSYFINEDNGREFVVSRHHSEDKLNQEGALIALLQCDYYRGFVWNKLFRADIFRGDTKKTFDTNIAFCEDLLLIFSCLLEGKTLFYSGTPLYHYRSRANSINQTYSNDRVSELRALQCMTMLSQSSSLRVQHLVECRYAEAAVNLLYYVKKAKQKEKVDFYKKEAKKYSTEFYKNADILFYEKVRFYCKLHFPLISVTIQEYVKIIYYRIRMLRNNIKIRK